MGRYAYLEKGLFAMRVSSIRGISHDMVRPWSIAKAKVGGAATTGSLSKFGFRQTSMRPLMTSLRSSPTRSMWRCGFSGRHKVVALPQKMGGSLAGVSVTCLYVNLLSHSDTLPVAVNFYRRSIFRRAPDVRRLGRTHRTLVPNH